MRTCPSCKLDKYEFEFYRHRKNNKPSDYCKICTSQKGREFYQNNKDKISLDHKKTRQKYLKDWTAFFIKKYNENPRCELCSIQLLWTSSVSMKNFVVCFDHKNNGNEIISCNPSTWYRERPCSEENKEIWNNNNFGILCNNCNKKLPTIDRIQWLKRALVYAEQPVDIGV